MKKPRAKKIKNVAVVENSFAGAIGMGAFPQNQQAVFGEQISQTNSMFKNLRWYLVSNFRQLLSELYVELGLVQTIVDVPVDDALRGGVIIKSKQLDEDQIEELMTSIDRDNDLNNVGQAAKWTRLFGGGGILIITDQDPMEPLDLDALNMDEPLEFRPVDMWELYYDRQNVEGWNPTQAKYAKEDEESQYYSYYGMKIHKSRVMSIKGIEAPSFIRPRLRGWGYSVVEKLVRGLNQYLKATDLSYEVLDEFKLDIFKIKNLANTLMSPQGEAQVRRRVQMANWQKNYQNAMVMDSEDDFDHKQLSFTGIAETMKEIRMQIASEMRMPMTKIFGMSSAGFNSGEDDIEVYNAMVESEVRSKIKYIILRVLEIKCQRMFAMIPDDLQIEFKPLRVLNALDEETVKTQKFTRLQQAKAAGEITTFEFREAINKGHLLDITLDTAGDELNPDDPDVAGLVAGLPDPKKEIDGDDDGADRMDTETPQDPATKNSVEYDLAAYKEDGGDGQFDPRRAELYVDDYRFQDKGLYQKAKAASMKALGTAKWQFILWWYKLNGGAVK